MSRPRTSYSPTEEEVLAALRAYQEKRGSATTKWVEVTLADSKGLAYDETPHQRSSPIASGAVLRHLRVLGMKGIVVEVATMPAYNTRKGEKTWVTADRSVEVLAERAHQAARDAERRKAVTDALRCLSQHGIEGRRSHTNEVGVPVDGLLRLLAAAGWEPIDDFASAPAPAHTSADRGQGADAVTVAVASRTGQEEVAGR